MVLEQPLPVGDHQPASIKKCKSDTLNASEQQLTIQPLSWSQPVHIQIYQILKLHHGLVPIQGTECGKGPRKLNFKKGCAKPGEINKLLCWFGSNLFPQLFHVIKTS